MINHRMYIISVTLICYFALFSAVALAQNTRCQEYGMHNCIPEMGCTVATAAFFPNLCLDSSNNSCDLEDCLNVDQQPVRLVLAINYNPDNPLATAAGFSGFSDEAFDAFINHEEPQIQWGNHASSTPLYLQTIALLC